MASCCQRSVLTAIDPMKPGAHSIRSGAIRPPSFLDSPKTDIINLTALGFHFGRTRAKEWAESQNLCARSAAKNWKAPKAAPIKAPDTTAFSLRTPTATNWKSAAAKIQTLRSDKVPRRVGG